MQAGERKKLAYLVALLAVLAAIWVYRAFTGGEAGRTADKGGPGRAAVILQGQQVTVRMDLLERKSPKLSVGRNIFNPAYKKPVVKPPPPAPQPGQPVARPAGPPPPPPKSREQLMKETAEAEMKKFKFMGFLKRSGRTDVFLALDSDYYVATVGETITKGYYLKEIGKDHLMFADRESGAEARVDVNFEEEDKGNGKAVPAPRGSGGAAPAASPPPPGTTAPVPAIPPRGDSAAQRGGSGQTRGLPPSRGGEHPEEDTEEEVQTYRPAVIINRSVR